MHRFLTMVVILEYYLGSLWLGFWLWLLTPKAKSQMCFCPKAAITAVQIKSTSPLLSLSFGSKNYPPATGYENTGSHSIFLILPLATLSPVAAASSPRRLLVVASSPRQLHAAASSSPLRFLTTAPSLRRRELAQPPPRRLELPHRRRQLAPPPPHHRLELAPPLPRHRPIPPLGELCHAQAAAGAGKGKLRRAHPSQAFRPRRARPHAQQLPAWAAPLGKLGHARNCRRRELRRTRPPPARVPP